MSTPKICPIIAAGNPLHMAKCRKDGCAWWVDDYCAVLLAVNSIIGADISLDNAASGILELAEHLEELLFPIPEQEKTSGSAANTDGGHAEQDKNQAVSASDYTRYQGEVQV